MEILGPKYPFEPLPPPDDVPVRGLTGIAKKAPSLGKAIQLETKKPEFRNLMADKSKVTANPVETSHEMRKLAKAAQDFEAFFIYSILKNFNSSSLKSSLFPEAPGRDMYMDMFFQGVSEEMSKRPGGLGLADLIVESVKATLTPSNQIQKEIKPLTPLG